MRSNEHTWRRSRGGTSQRFFLGAIVAASFTLVAFEWRTTDAAVKVHSDISWEEDWIEPMVVVVTEKPQPKDAVVKKRSSVVDPLVTEPLPPDPTPVPDPDPGSGEPALVPTPTLDPDPVHTAPVSKPLFVPSAAVKPYFDQCLSEDPEHVDPCTEERILAHLQRKFRMPRSVRRSVRTTVTFRVEADGTVGRIVCAPRVDEAVQSEVERVLRAMPTFVPGSQGGVPVPVHYQIPLSLRMAG